MAARAPLRARVFHPAGSECSCPKQWHSGLRPRARLTVMPTRNTERSASAARAPHQAVDAGKRVAATASSARGRSSPSGAASDEGRPKSTMACREPSRSVSLATPATAKTRASSKRVTNRAAYNNPSPFPLGPPGLLTATRDSVVYDAASLTCGAADMFKAITPAGATYLARTTAVSKAARLERSLARIHWARERGRTGGESRARGTANSRGIAGTRRHHDDAPAVLALLVSRALGRRLARHAACNRGARAHAAGADVVLVAGRAVGPVLNDAEALRTTDRTMALVDHRHACAVGVGLALDTALSQCPSANPCGTYIVFGARMRVITGSTVGLILSYADTRLGAHRLVALIDSYARAIDVVLASDAVSDLGAGAHAGRAYVAFCAGVAVVAGRAVGPVLNDAEAPSTTDCPVAQVYGDTLAVGVALASDTAFGQRPCANSSSAHVVRSARVQIVTRGAVGHVLDAAEAVGAGRPLALVVWGRALARVLALVAPAGGGVEGFSWGAILDAGVVAGAQRLAGCTSADLAAALGVLDAIT